jgi:hypothetical protein
MNQSLSSSPNQHQKVQLLLPWYVNQSLLKHEHRLVEDHIHDCLACRRELDNLRKLAEAVAEAPDPDLAAETSFASLRAKLPARAIGRAQPTASAKPSMASGIGRFTPRAGVRFAMAACLLLTVIPLTLYMARTNMAGDYYTLSAAKPESAGGKELRVVFANSLSPVEVASILAEIHGRRIGEPNSAGALTVRIETDADSPRLDEAIALLRSRQDVLLAEPVVQP